jgi:hypothetical protein
MARSLFGKRRGNCGVTRAFFFSGPPGSGKDEACKFLVSQCGFKHLAFKDQLFLDTAKYYDVSLDWFIQGYTRELKDKPEEKLDGRSRRRALIHVSENFIKPKFGKSYYGHMTCQKMDSISRYCFSDSGFSEEAFPIINSVGSENAIIVQLARHDCTYANDSREYIHGILQDEFVIGNRSNFFSSSSHVFPVRMYRIHNNADIGDFHSVLRIIIRKEENAFKSKEKNIHSF